jgi:phenylpyruvate tautomerase PptA (4-oxalocrotonate tautomerase family)
MPIQIRLSEGLIPKSKAQALHHQVSQLFLDIHQLSGNLFLQPNVIGEVIFVDRDLTFANQTNTPIAVIELKVPTFTFGAPAQKEQFIEKATDMVFNACDGKLAKTAIWVNVVHTVDGLWGIGGKAYSNEALQQAIVGTVA